MKTPEELALEYTANIADSHSVKAACEKAFMAGYMAATKEHREEIETASRIGYLAGYKAAQQWISVKDRLPDKSPMVLAMCTDGYELAYYGMYGQGWTNTLGTEHLNVTHWHVLPTPPEEEK